jgi:antitoxin MazE
LTGSRAGLIVYRMQSRISKWGNSLGLRIPEEAAKAASLREGDLVEIVEEAGTLRIVRIPEIDIHALIAAITPENLNRDEEWINAESVGREI